MKKKSAQKTGNFPRKIIPLFCLFFALISCEENQYNGDIPYVPVDLRINYKSLLYSELHRQNGWMYFPGGNRGVLVYRNAGESFTAFERNCPNNPSADCATIEVDPSNLFIVCNCCTSRFDFYGTVLSGPSPLPLLQYRLAISSNFLIISN